MHYLHWVRGLLIQSRAFVRAFLLCALLLGSQFGLAMDLASAQGTRTLSVNWVQRGPSGPSNVPSGGPANGVPSGSANGVPSGPANGVPSGPANGVPSGPANGVPSGPAGGVPSGPAGGVPSGAPGKHLPALPPTGSCPFAVPSQC